MQKKFRALHDFWSSISAFGASEFKLFDLILLELEQVLKFPCLNWVTCFGCPIATSSCCVRVYIRVIIYKVRKVEQDYFLVEKQSKSKVK